MDYDALAKQYGGADAAPVIDYDALAKQYGGADMPASTGISTARRAPGFMTQLGRGAASLADVTIGGILPGIAQQVAYPFARLGRSPEEAQATTQRISGAIGQPFGKAFGVAETPEYKQETGRQILDFIGQNFQKGAKWIAEKTGAPQADIESYMGSLTVAAPKIAGAVTSAVAPYAERAAIAAKMPFEGRAQARRERLSAEDYARGPQIDAAAEAQRLKLALNPTDIQATTGSRLTAIMAGEKGVQAITAANKNRIREISLDEMGLPRTARLDSADTFDQARAQVAGPYREVESLPIQQADDAMLKRLESIRSDLDIIGAKEYAPAISKIVDDAISKTQTGLTGETLLKNIQVLRERAKRTYNNKSATSEALDIADTNLRIATELESLIDNSISNPKLLEQFRNAREKMARIYAYEGATNINTGMVDVSKLARITSSNNALTGDIASLGKIAGNFPEAFTAKAATPWAKVTELGRTGVVGTFGGLVGYALDQGYTGAAIGSLLGAGAGKVGQSIAANRLASPAYQAGLNLRDMRIPVNQLAAAQQPIPRENALVPYQPDALNAAPGVSDASKLRIVSYDENGVPIYAADERSRQGFTMAQEPAFGPEPTPFAQRSITSEVPRQIYEAQKNAELAQEFRAASERIPARGGADLVFDAAGNLVEAPRAGAGGVVGAPSSLESAVAKIAGQMQAPTATEFSTRRTSRGTRVKTEDRFGPLPGRPITSRTGTEYATTGETTTGASTREPTRFDLTAEESIAWDKASADLASASPEFGKLTPTQIAGKMMDRQWVADAVQKVREKAQAYDEIAKRSAARIAESEAAQAANELSRQPFGARAFDEPLSNQLRSKAERRQAGPRAFDEVAKQASAIADRDRMLDLLMTLEDTLRPPRRAAGGAQGPKTREFLRNQLLTGTENNNALAPRITIGGIGRDETKK
jgi:hypothetical protein